MHEDCIRSNTNDTVVVYIDPYPPTARSYKYDFMNALARKCILVHLYREGALLRSWRKILSVPFGRHMLKRQPGGFYAAEYLRLFPFAHKCALFDRANMRITRFFISRFMQARNLRTAVTIITHPEDEGWLEVFDDSVHIYDVRDSYVDYPRNARKNRSEFLRKENELLGRADAVICVSEPLVERARRFNARTFLIPNGVQFDFFNARLFLGDAKRKRRNPVFLLIGSLDERVDFEWLRAAARTFPNACVRIVGPIKVRDKEQLKLIEQLKSEDNIVFTGWTPFEKFPDEIAGADVCLIPYRMSDYAHATSPLKLFQYLAMGKPVVASAIAPCEAFSPLIYTAETQEEFLNAIARVLSEDEDILKAKRIETARDASWERRVEQWSDVIVARAQERASASMASTRAEVCV